MLYDAPETQSPLEQRIERLEADLDKLSGKYQSLVGGITVLFFIWIGTWLLPAIIAAYT